MAAKAAAHDKGQCVGHIRVSTFEQNTERQMEGVSLDRAFTDRFSGKDTKRPELTALLAFVRERPGRHTQHI